MVGQEKFFFFEVKHVGRSQMRCSAGAEAVGSIWSAGSCHVIQWRLPGMGRWRERMGQMGWRDGPRFIGVDVTHDVAHVGDSWLAVWWAGVCVCACVRACVRGKAPCWQAAVTAWQAAVTVRTKQRSSDPPPLVRKLSLWHKSKLFQLSKALHYSHKNKKLIKSSKEKTGLNAKNKVFLPFFWKEKINVLACHRIFKN